MLGIFDTYSSSSSISPYSPLTLEFRRIKMFLTQSTEVDTNTNFSPVSPLEARLSNIEELKKLMPEKYEPYQDKYFLRTLEILQKEDLNPWVVAQVMIRKGPGIVGGIDEAIAIIDKYSDIRKHGGEVYAINDGDEYAAGESLMFIKAPIQDIVAFETMYLGVMSAATTRASGDPGIINLDDVTKNMREVVKAAEGKPVMYFGARHWTYAEDAQISKAAFDGGATSCSTDIGAATVGQKGVGTIPHVLENIMAWKYGRDNAVVEAMKAFDKHIDPSVPRISLIDYNNKEIDCSLAVAKALSGRLNEVRVDTCGENVGQGALKSASEAGQWESLGVTLPAESDPHAKYWYGNGVTVTGVYALRRALDENGYQDVKIVLSSGFGDVDKINAFNNAKSVFGVELYDELGVGGVYKSRSAKMDIVAVGENPSTMEAISKTGRGFKANDRVERVI